MYSAVILDKCSLNFNPQCSEEENLDKDRGIIKTRNGGYIVNNLWSCAAKEVGTWSCAGLVFWTAMGLFSIL